MRSMASSVLVACMAVSLTGCASRGATDRTAPVAGTAVTFANVTPGAPQQIPAMLVRPANPGPFPAVVQLHGCAGVEEQSYRWARWFAARGYVAMVVDSFTPRKVKGDCRTGPDEPPITARFDDAFGALRYLQAQPYVIPDRIGAIGWSQGGVYSMSVINGPSLERARQRGVQFPPAGFAASVAVYPGGCTSLTSQLVIRPLLVLLGGADDWTPPANCVGMVNAMRSRGADIELAVYPGAFHYFDKEGQREEVLAEVENDTRPGGYGATVAYQAEAAADAFRRVDAFFDRHLKRTPR